MVFDKFIVHKSIIIFCYDGFVKMTRWMAQRENRWVITTFYTCFLWEKENVVSFVKNKKTRENLALRYNPNGMYFWRLCILTLGFCNCRASIVHSTTLKLCVRLDPYMLVFWRWHTIQVMMTVTKLWVIWNMIIKLLLFVTENLTNYIFFLHSFLLILIFI